jgi:hypothetical protein
MQNIRANTIIINFGHGCPNHCRAVRLAVTSVEIIDKPKKGQSHMLEITIKTNQQARLAIAPIGKGGEAEPLDGKITATILSGSGSVEISDDNKILFVPSDTPGPVDVEFSGDAQEGEGKEVISEQVRFNVQHPNAVTLGVGLAAIEDKGTVATPAPVADPAPATDAAPAANP